MKVSSWDYENLNQYGAILILLLLRMIFGAFTAILGALASNRMLAPGYGDLPVLQGVTAAVLILCIIFFFMRNIGFIISYGFVIILTIAINVRVNPGLIPAILIVEGLFMTYLLVSKRVKILFRTTAVDIEEQDGSITHFAAGAKTPSAQSSGAHTRSSQTADSKPVVPKPLSADDPLARASRKVIDAQIAKVNARRRKQK